MTVYGQTSAQFYIENAKSAPLFTSLPFQQVNFPNRKIFGTIFAWVQAERCVRNAGEFYWKETLRHYAIAKVIKE